MNPLICGFSGMAKPVASEPLPALPEPKVVGLPQLPRSDSTQAEQAIEAVFQERHYPTSPAAAARVGFEAARRISERNRMMTMAAQISAGHLEAGLKLPSPHEQSHYWWELYRQTVEENARLRDELNQLKGSAAA